jgi:N-acyl-D-aspartate/D-glutamate deacylase
VESSDREVRASDAEREAVVEQLQRALTQGRLTVSEFEERVQVAYAARTLGALSDLTRDLPRNLW